MPVGNIAAEPPRHYEVRPDLEEPAAVVSDDEWTAVTEVFGPLLSTRVVGSQSTFLSFELVSFLHSTPFWFVFAIFLMLWL